ncbi:TPA: glycosyltransferase [Clostridium perfringens]
MEKNILMIVYNDLNIDSRVQRNAEVLSKLGNLTIIHSGKNKSCDNNYNCISIYSKYKGNIIKYMSFVKNTIRYVNKNKKNNLFYANDFFSALPLIIIKLLKKSDKFVYDAHELYIPEKNKKFSIRDYFFYFMEKFAIKNSDLIICAQDNRAEIMKEHYKLKNKPLVIRNISLLPKKDEYKLDVQLKEFFENDSIKIVYSGIISKERNLCDVIDSVNLLNKNYKLLIIGYGDGVNEIKDKLSSINNKKILYIGKVEYNNMYSILKKCDIGVISYPTEGLNNLYCAPNKIFEYASVGLPMVSFYNPSIKEEFKKYNIGIAKNNIEDAIIEVSNNINFFKDNLKIFLESNSWEKESCKFYEVLDRILKQ